MVYQDLEPGSHKTKEMAQHLASAFPDAKKFLFVDHVPKEAEEDGAVSTVSAISTDSTDGVPSAEATADEAGGVASGAAGSGTAEGGVAGPEAADGHALTASEPPMTQALAQAGGGGGGPAVREGFTLFRDVYGRTTLRPWSKEERMAHKAARRKAQVHLQRVGEKLLKATGNLHYVNVLPTLVSSCSGTVLNLYCSSL